MAKRKLTVQEAADVLETSVDAVRQRIKRGKLERAEPDDPSDSRVYVWLDVDHTDTRHEAKVDSSPNGDALVESLQDQVEYLRDQLEREREANRENRRLLAAALERIPPQLEAPRDTPPESPVSTGPTRTPTEGAGGPQTARETPLGEEEQQASRRGFWARLFGPPDE
jgi:hypothetical protein